MPLSVLAGSGLSERHPSKCGRQGRIALAQWYLATPNRRLDSSHNLRVAEQVRGCFSQREGPSNVVVRTT